MIYCWICGRSIDPSSDEEGWTWNWNRRVYGSLRFECPNHTYVQLTLWEE